MSALMKISPPGNYPRPSSTPTRQPHPARGVSAPTHPAAADDAQSMAASPRKSITKG
jgi:hypothetical protein